MQPPGVGGFGGAGFPSAPSPGRISLVEPGPVMTEFEEKLYEEAKRADYSRTDPETADIFTNLYLRNSRDVFASLGQTPEDIAEVTGRGWPCQPGDCPFPTLPARQPLGGLFSEASISPIKEQRPPQLLPPWAPSGWG